MEYKALALSSGKPEGLHSILGEPTLWARWVYYHPNPVVPLCPQGGT
ncbi:MAG TPA: hypothetical protein VMT04_06240 [Terriglobales bacterium]|nr:hypothetical protein [Terriglobales bacterium]